MRADFGIEPAREALSWVWPPAMLGLTVWMIVQAHRLHHAVETKAGAVSFGFLWAPPAETLKAELGRRDRAGLRAPSG